MLLPPFRGGGEGRIDHGGAHDQAGATPEGGVVHAAVFIAREVPDVQNVERPEPTLQGLAGQAETQRPREHLRKERQDQRSPCRHGTRSEEQPSELQSLMRISYAAFRLQNKTKKLY